MKVFVAGATGVLGRRAVPLLVRAGHEVSAVARGEQKADLVRSLGGTPVTVDLFDPAAVKGVVAGHDVVCNLATHIPPLRKSALRSAWRENDRIRTEVSEHLVDAAIATGAARYIQESIAFMYPDRGDGWIDEDTPVDAPDYVQSALVAENQTERFAASGHAGVVLRFGGFHAPESDQTTTIVRAARRGIAMTMGKDDGFFPWIHIDDAASAVVAALAAPSGTYNVVDEPTTRAEYRTALAAAVGRRRLVSPPAALAKTSGSIMAMLGRSERVSNRRFREATGWAPAYPTVREIWPAIVSAQAQAQGEPAGS